MPNEKIISVVMLSVLLLLSGCTGAQEAGADTGSRVHGAASPENKFVAEAEIGRASCRERVCLYV